jgi:hypothetical protein
MRRMPDTTDTLRDEIVRLSRIIAQIESKPAAEWAVWAPTLRDLRAERRSLDRVIRFRNAEASKKVVELSRWRDGPLLRGRRTGT